VTGLRRVQVRVLGRVQGVGYRFFVQRVARELHLTGWVRNEADGSVVLEAQGTEAPLQELIRELRFGPSLAQVDDLRIDWLDPARQEPGFQVRFG
jgi:acylphosphatase